MNNCAAQGDSLRFLCRDNLLTLGISLEENVILDKDVPVRQSFDLSYIDFEHPANNIWQVTEEFCVP